MTERETITATTIREAEINRAHRYFLYAIENWVRKSFEVRARNPDEQGVIDQMDTDLALMVNLQGSTGIESVLKKHMASLLALLPEDVTIVSRSALKDQLRIPEHYLSLAQEAGMRLVWTEAARVREEPRND